MIYSDVGDIYLHVTFGWLICKVQRPSEDWFHCWFWHEFVFPLNTDVNVQYTLVSNLYVKCTAKPTSFSREKVSRKIRIHNRQEKDKGTWIIVETGQTTTRFGYLGISLLGRRSYIVRQPDSLRRYVRSVQGKRETWLPTKALIHRQITRFTTALCKKCTRKERNMVDD